MSIHASKGLGGLHDDARQADAECEEQANKGLFETLYAKRKKLGDFKDPVPDEDNPNAIFKERYLRRGQMLLINSTLGVGKSTFVSQGSECWARGLPFCDIHPARALKIAVFETEDDADEIADFRNNFRKVLKRDGWTELEIGSVENGENAPVYYDVADVGTGQFIGYLEYCASRDKPDVVIINPAYDFIAGDFSKAEDVKDWKSNLLTLARRHGFAVILVHHTNKVPSNKKERDDWLTGTSAAYSGSGSMVLPSSARAVMFIRPLENDKAPGVYEIVAAKREGRLGWRDLDANKTRFKYMAHSSDIIYWREATEDEIKAVMPKKKNAATSGCLPVGVQRVIDVCTEHGRPFDTVADLKAALRERYECKSDTTTDNWINKAIDAKKCSKVKTAAGNNAPVRVGLVSQFEAEEDASDDE